jgi:hypothetical protein
MDSSKRRLGESGLLGGRKGTAPQDAGCGKTGLIVRWRPTCERFDRAKKPHPTRGAQRDAFNGLLKISCFQCLSASRRLGGSISLHLTESEPRRYQTGFPGDRTDHLTPGFPRIGAAGGRAEGDGRGGPGRIGLSSIREGGFAGGFRIRAPVFPSGLVSPDANRGGRAIPGRRSCTRERLTIVLRTSGGLRWLGTEPEGRNARGSRYTRGLRRLHRLDPSHPPPAIRS